VRGNEPPPPPLPLRWYPAQVELHIERVHETLEYALLCRSSYIQKSNNSACLPFNHDTVVHMFYSA
jgi:hypothetical protein